MISSSQGQPNHALSQLALMKLEFTGSSESTLLVEVIRMFQPPLSGASFLARRATRVCQSIDCMSTLRPAFSISDLAIGAMLVRT